MHPVAYGARVGVVGKRRFNNDLGCCWQMAPELHRVLPVVRPATVDLGEPGLPDGPAFPQSDGPNRTMTKITLGSLIALACIGGCATSPPGGEPVHLWPLFSREVEPEYESLEVLWPLYSQEARGADRFLVRQIPLFTWQRRDQEKELDVLWPFFNVQFGGETSALRVAPLYFRHRSPNRASDVVFPVFWWQRGEHFHLWPLYYWDEDEGHGTLWPLIGFSEERMKVLPFYYSRQTEDESLQFVFPHGHWTSGKKRARWVVPFYLDRHGPGTELHLVLPFWFDSTNAEQEAKNRVLFPFYWDLRRKEDFTTVVAPIYGRRHTAAGRDTHFVAPPLYIYDQQKPLERATHHVLWPMFQFGSGPGYSQTRVLPFEYGVTEYETNSDGDGEVSEGLRYRSHFRVYPLYYAAKAATDSGDVVRHHTLFPLWWYGDDPVQQTSHNVVFPLLWHFRSAEKATDALFPIFWTEKDLTADENYFAFLWPLAWYTSSPEARDFRLLWKLVQVSSDETTNRRLWAFNPIVRSESVGDDRRFDILGGLFGVRVQEGETTFRLFYFFNL